MSNTILCLEGDSEHDRLIHLVSYLSVDSNGFFLSKGKMFDRGQLTRTILKGKFDKTPESVNLKFFEFLPPSDQYPLWAYNLTKVLNINLLNGKYKGVWYLGSNLPFPNDNIGMNWRDYITNINLKRSRESGSVRFDITLV